MSYATLAELKVWIAGGSDLDTDDDTGLQLALDAASLQIDRLCGRTFVSATGATHYYYPKTSTELDVIDLVSVTSMASDSHGDRTFATTFSTTDYELLPYTDATGVPSVRYQQVHIWPTSSKSFAIGRQVRIIGDFGYLVGGGVPADIKQACLIQSSRLWKRRETPMGTLSVPDIGQDGPITKTDPDVEALLATYTRSGSSSWVLV